MSYYKNENFNLLTMTPLREQDTAGFIQFRTSHIIKIWKIFLAYMALINVIQIIKFFQNPTDAQMTIAGSMSATTTMNLLVLLAGQRFKRYFVYLIVLSFLPLECFNTIIARATFQTELVSDCANNALYRFDYHCMFFALFLCPTTKYLACWFVPIYIAKYNLVVLGTHIDIWFRVS